MVAALLCAGCGPAATPAAHGSPASTPAIAPAAALAAAGADTYANRYADADAAYVRLITASPRSARLHAAYAVFLEYRGDAGDALSQAQRAASLDARSGEAQAALCRVHDWAGDFTAAVAAGRSAVTLAADDPLAHLFDSEALADSGDLSDARTQLATAATLVEAHPTPYLRAELERETADVNSVAGDPADQIAALQRAAALQPGWLYRAEELANAQWAAGQGAAARQTLETAATPLPADVDALQGVGEQAILTADAPLAQAAWQAASSLAPADSRILDTVGELQVAAKGDINAAIATFEHALAVNPGDLDAAAYLTALARFVQGDASLAQQEIDAGLAAGARAGTAHAPPRPDVTAAAAAAAAQALSLVNAVRAQAGLPPVHLDDRLTASAASHTYYWLFNNLSPSVADLGIHRETPGLLGYSGVDSAVRAQHFGYPASPTAEDITHRTSAVAAVHDWVNSVFHRFPILRPDLQAIGYAQAQAGPITMQDMEFGYSQPAGAAPVAFPAAGQADVPVRFVDNELPDPVPSGGQRTTGYPVTVTFGAADSVTLSSFILSGPDGAPLEAHVLAPAPSTENSASLLPSRPLLPDTAYTARIDATVDGTPYVQSWRFTTGS